MMRVCACMALLSLSLSAARADSGPYVAIDLGEQRSTGHFEPRLGSAGDGSVENADLLGLGLGYRWPGGYRVEGSVRYRDARGRAAGFAVEVETVNASAQWFVEWPLSMAQQHDAASVYLLAGIGVAHHIVTSPVLPRGERSGLIGSLGAGLSWKLGKRLNLDLEWQYLDLGSVATGVLADGKRLVLRNYTAHELTLGLRYRF